MKHSASLRGRLASAGLVAGAAVCAVAVTACGSSGSTSSSESTSSSSSAAATTSLASATPAGLAAYNGPTGNLPSAFPVPAKTPGTVKIGYLQITSAQPTLAAEERGAAQRAAQLGVQLIVKDAELSPQAQVAQLQQMLVQGVKAIIVYPVVPASLAPELAAAKRAGVAIIGDSSRPDVTQPPLPGYLADLEEPNDRAAFAMAQTAAQMQPKAQFGVIGTALPIAILKYLISRERYWGQRLGLKLVGEADAQQDTPAGYGTAINQLLSNNPGIQEIWTYDEPQALTAATIIHSSGRHVKVFTTNVLGDQTETAAVQNGGIAMAYQGHWADQGTQMMNAAYDAATHQGGKLPTTVVVPGTVVTKATASASATG